MILNKTNYKNEDTNFIIEMSEGEKDKMTHLQKNCLDLHMAFESETRDEDEFLSLSSQFSEACEQNKIYPPKYLDEINIINDSGKFINQFPNPLFVRNILKGLYHIFRYSNYALQKFISMNPSQLLLKALGLPDINIRRQIYQIINLCCKTNEGVIFVTQSPLIINCFQSIHGYFQILQNDMQENSPNIDIVCDILNVFISIIEKSPPGTGSYLNDFFEICKFCFESNHFFEFINHGICILAHLARGGFYKEVLQSNLFQRVMSFLCDDRLRKNYVKCINFATYLSNDISMADSEILNLQSFAIEQIPVPNIISLFINNQSDELLAEACCNLFLNIVMSSSQLDTFINHPEFNEFISSLKECIGCHSLETKIAASWFAWNMLRVGLREQQTKIFMTGLLDYLEDSIEFEDEEFIIKVVIGSIKRIIKSYRYNGCETVEPYQRYLLQLREFVKNLYYNDNVNIHRAAQVFMKEYYPDLIL